MSQLRRVSMSLLVSLGALTACAAMVPGAAASNGSFSKAVANSDWTKAEINGSVSWGGCTLSKQIAPFHREPSRCDSWIPYVMVQPALPSYRCSWESAWDASDRNIWHLWRADTQRSPGARLRFNLSNVQILPTVQGQRVCLVALVFEQVTNETCKAFQYEKQYMGWPTSTCQLIPRVSGEVIAEALLSEERPLSMRQAVGRAKAALARKYKKGWTSGKGKKVACSQTRTAFKCTATWKSAGKTRRGSVTIPRV